MNNDFNNFIAESEEESIDFRAVAWRYLRRWYLFAIFLLLAFAVAFLYMRYTRPVYKVSSVILIKDEKKGMKAGMEILEGLDMGGNKIVENEIEVLKSRTLMKKVVEALRLNVSYFREASPIDTDLYGKSPIWIQLEQMIQPAYKGKLIIHLLDKNKFEVIANGNALGEFTYGQAVNNNFIGRFRVFLNDKQYRGEDEIKVSFAPVDNVVGANLGSLDVSLLNQKSTVLSLTYQETSPERGKDILRNLNQQYTLAALGDKNTEATNTLRFIDDRLRLLTGELTDVEKDVEVYKSQAGFTDISSESNLFLEKVKETDTKLNEVDIKIKMLEGVERFLSAPNANVSAVNSMIEDPILMSLTEKLSELELQREKYARTVQEGNPLLETVQTQILNTKQAIRENVNNQKRSLGLARQSLASLNRGIESSIRSIPRKEREFVSIKRQQGIKESLYLLLLQKKEETAISYASTVSDSRLVDEAFATPLPVKPSKSVIWLIAILAGLGIPVLIINILALVNDRVESRAEFENKSKGVPVLGEVGHKPQKLKGPLLDIKSNNFVVEQFRILRTNLQFTLSNAIKGKARKVLLTSSISGEGKSFISLNLSASLASAGNKVILVNLDIRKPKLHEYINLPNDVGIVNYLIGQRSIEQLVQPTSINNLFFIASGPVPPNPAELISNPRMAQFLTDLENTYDFIIIDCSPSGLVTDAQIVAPLVDGTIFVVRHEYTPKAALINLAAIYKAKSMPALTVVYNGVKGSSTYGYGYGYGSVYGYYGGNKESSWWERLKERFE
jgi:capsular exopolysaccharide synthesis family protein